MHTQPLINRFRHAIDTEDRPCINLHFLYTLLTQGQQWKNPIRKRNYISFMKPHKTSFIDINVVEHC